MAEFFLRINGQEIEVDAPGEMPLLWVLREKLNLVGTKYGCGIGACGACTVLVNGVPVRSCLVPASDLVQESIVTIEGLSPSGEHPVQRAWNEEDVPQCGFCQAGQILTASALIDRNPNPSVADVDAAMAGVLCRCGTYGRIRKAISRAVNISKNESES